MKKILFFLLPIWLLSACGGWDVAPQPFPVWTAIPSRTPAIFTVTPQILAPSPSTSPTPGVIEITPVPATDTLTPTASATPPTDTPAPTFTPIPVQALQVEILGCNTGFDVSHGMGEVTNAYVVLKNTGTVDLPNACGLLRAADEDRIHPDKQVCVSNLPVNHQVTLKLTVDSAFKQSTIIQVDGLSNDVVLLRIDKPACTDLDLVGGVPGDIGLVKPIVP